MYSFKKSLLALISLSVLTPIVAALGAAPGLGQGRSGGAPPAKDINVVNTADNPVPVRDVDNWARQPFASTIFRDFGSEATADISLITVPVGKRLVIEHASAQSTFPANDLVRAELLYPAPTGELVQFLVIHRQGTDSLSQYLRGQFRHNLKFSSLSGN